MLGNFQIKHSPEDVGHFGGAFREKRQGRERLSRLCSRHLRQKVLQVQARQRDPPVKLLPRLPEQHLPENQLQVSFSCPEKAS